MLLLSAMLALAMVPGRSRADSGLAAIGLWSDPIKGWVVETRPCDSGVCGFLVAFRASPVAGQDSRDLRNPDPAERGRPLCGLKLLGGFKPSGVPNQWTGGWVYDPQSGTRYTGEARLIDTNTFSLRAYTLVPMFGRTITLFRWADATDRCQVPAALPFRPDDPLTRRAGR